MSDLLTSLTAAANSMAAYQQEMQVVQNDTTNASTPGYVAQNLLLEALPFKSDGSDAGGVTTGNLVSARDLYAEQNVQTQTAAENFSTTTYNTLAALNPTFSLQSSTSISPSFNTFFSAVSQLTVTPNDSQLRQSVITTAQGISQAFQTANQGITSAASNIDQNATGVVSSINQIVRQIQQLNVQRRQLGTQNLDPGLNAQMYSDLENLSQYVNFTTIQSPDGTMNIYLDGQQGLLVGTSQLKLQMTATPNQLQVTDSNGVDVTSEITGGSLGAYVTPYNTTLPGYTSQLNSLASGFADSVNNQLAAGVDSNNNPGAALFAYNAAAPAGTLAVSSTITPAEIAAASAGKSGWQRQRDRPRQPADGDRARRLHFHAGLRKFGIGRWL
jgi:flagellar hook-associated protein 1